MSLNDGASRSHFASLTVMLPNNFHSCRRSENQQYYPDPLPILTSHSRKFVATARNDSAVLRKGAEVTVM